MLRHCTAIFKNDDGTRYIFTQILCDFAHNYAVMVPYAMKLSVFASSKFLCKKEFPQLIILYNSDNCLFNRGGRKVFYPDRHSHAPIFFHELSDLTGTTHISTAGYHPLANGIVGRFHRQPKAVIRIFLFVLLGTAWEENLGRIVCPSFYEFQMNFLAYIPRNQ